MGRAMASNVSNAGFELTDHDLRDAAVGELTRLGTKVATSRGGPAKGAEVV